MWETTMTARKEGDTWKSKQLFWLETADPQLILNGKNSEDTHWSFNHILVAAAELWVEGLREIECISRYSLDDKTGFIQVSSSYCRKGKVNSRAK